MDIDQVLQDLKRKFEAPLNDYYQRRIVFWYDEDREFEDKLDQVTLDNVKLIILNGHNTFSVKKLLSHDDLVSNYLVYEPNSYAEPDDDWLLGLKLCSDSFRSDLISIWMDEMHMPSSLTMRNEIKTYKKFFNSKERRAKLAALPKLPDKPESLQLAMMAVICGVKEPMPNKIMQKVLSSGFLDESLEYNAMHRAFEQYGLSDAFWTLAYKWTGYPLEAEHKLSQLIIQTVLTALTKTVAPDKLLGLEKYIIIPHQAHCYDLVADWVRTGNEEEYYNIARFVEREALLQKRLSALSIEELLNIEFLPCANEVILTKCLTDISQQIIDEKLLTKVVNTRKGYAWYDVFAPFYDGILQIANMQTFFKEHAEGFHLAQPLDIWNAYTKDYYRMDSYYRAFHLAFQKSLENTIYPLDDLFKQAVEQVEGLYLNWYLEELGANWMNICEEELGQYGKLLSIPQQEDFYASKVMGNNARTFVIISDAMRYEVAVSLAEELRQKNQCKVEIEGLEGIFPTITKFGMAALLPHDELKAKANNDSIEVLAGNLPTGSNYRDKVLKHKNPASVAVKYNDLINMKRDERNTLVKGMEVVYIYHDTIDEASHHSDAGVFPACEKAINEIKNLVKIIVNSFSGTKILITSDHGFLYTFSPLTEDDKVDTKSFGKKDIEYGRRYAIMEKGATPDFLMPVQLLGGHTAFDGFAPRENVRIKMSGGGLNFVHGGISLQELVVPLITYNHLRSDSVEYRRNKGKYDTEPVEVNVLSASSKISNMIFNLDFYQKEAVGRNYTATSYKVYFTDEYGNLISDMQRIVADRENENNTERTFHCTFNLKPLQYKKTDIYYLVLEEESGKRIPQRKEFQIDIAFAVDDFGFFDE